MRLIFIVILIAALTGCEKDSHKCLKGHHEYNPTGIVLYAASGNTQPAFLALDNEDFICDKYEVGS